MMFCVATNGCIRRKSEAVLIRRWLSAMGHVVVADKEQADVVLYIGCAATEAKEETRWLELRQDVDMGRAAV